MRLVCWRQIVSVLSAPDSSFGDTLKLHVVFSRCPFLKCLAIAHFPNLSLPLCVPATRISRRTRWRCAAARVALVSVSGVVSVQPDREMESKSLLLQAGRREMNGRGAEARGDNPAGQWRAAVWFTSQLTCFWCMVLDPSVPWRSREEFLREITRDSERRIWWAGWDPCAWLPPFTHHSLPWSRSLFGREWLKILGP